MRWLAGLLAATRIGTFGQGPSPGGESVDTSIWVLPSAASAAINPTLATNSLPATRSAGRGTEITCGAVIRKSYDGSADASLAPGEPKLAGGRPYRSSTTT